MKIFSKEMLKKKKGGNTSETYFEDIKREIAIMKKLSHPNVLKLFEVLDDPKVNKMYLVLEYMKRGDLLNFLKNREKDDEPLSSLPGSAGNGGKRKNSEKLVTLSDSELKVIFTQVVAGVKYLHFQNIIHGDIKPQVKLIREISEGHLIEHPCIR
jgi:serine/threonine protein kinase